MYFVTNTFSAESADAGETPPLRQQRQPCLRYLEPALCRALLREACTAVDYVPWLLQRMLPVSVFSVPVVPGSRPIMMSLIERGTGC